MLFRSRASGITLGISCGVFGRPETKRAIHVAAVRSAPNTDVWEFVQGVLRSLRNDGADEIIAQYR